MSSLNGSETRQDSRALDRKIDAMAWGLVFVWVGVAMLAHLGWGIGFIGVGAIALGAQAWRRRVRERVDRFSLIVGAFFVLVGIWNLFNVRVDLVPVLFILAGLALLFPWIRRAARQPAR